MKRLVPFFFLAVVVATIVMIVAMVVVRSKHRSAMVREAGVSSVVPVSSVIPRKKMGDRKLPPHKPMHAKHGDPLTSANPLVLQCMKLAADWPTLRTCLQGIPVDSSVVPLGDAGMKMGTAPQGSPPGPGCPVPYWSVNWVTGNDSNNCTTALTPCKTVAAIQSRRGPGCVNAGVEIEVEQDSPESMSFSEQCAPTGYFYVQGDVVSTIATGTFSGVVPKVRTGAAHGLIANLGSSAPSFLYTWIEDTTKLAHGFVTGQVNGDVMAITQMLDDTTYAEVTPSNGDTFAIQHIAKVDIASITDVTEGCVSINGVENTNAAGAIVSGAYIEDSIIDGDVTLTDIKFENVVVGGVTNQASIFGGNNFVSAGALPSSIYIHAAHVSMGGDIRVQSIMDVYGDVDYDYIDAESPSLSFGSTYYPNIYDLYIVNYGSMTPNGTDAPEDIGNPADAAIYGTMVLSPINGTFLYTGTATNAFAGMHINDGRSQVVATAVDYSQSIEQYYPGRALSQAQLDTSILLGGFGGVALQTTSNLPIYQVVTTTYPTISNFVQPLGNGGTGRDAGGPAYSVALWEGPTSPMGATASCTGGNVLTCNSGADPSFQAPANSSYAINSTTTSTATWTTVTSLTVVVPTGATLSVHADENMDLPLACASTGVVGVMGLGIDSSSVATVTSLVSLSAGAYDSLIDDFKSLALNYGTSALSAGTHTVYLLTKNNSATCTITVNGDIVADVFP